jgi:hypothetical protein
MALKRTHLVTGVCTIVLLSTVLLSVNWTDNLPSIPINDHINYVENHVLSPKDTILLQNVDNSANGNDAFYIQPLMPYVLGQPTYVKSFSMSQIMVAKTSYKLFLSVGQYSLIPLTISMSSGIGVSQQDKTNSVPLAGLSFPPVKPQVEQPTLLSSINVPPQKPILKNNNSPTARNGQSSQNSRNNQPVSNIPATNAAIMGQNQPVFSESRGDSLTNGRVKVSMIPYTGAPFVTSGVVWEVYQNDPVTKTVAQKIFSRSDSARHEFSLPAGNYVLRATYNNMTADLLVPVREKGVYQYILNFYAGEANLVADLPSQTIDASSINWEIRPRSDKSRVVASARGHMPRVPLREGNYIVTAQSGSWRGEAQFQIRAGRTGEVKVMLKAIN